MNSIKAGDWFIVEPYVMNFSNKKHYLFYNTLSGDFIEGVNFRSLKIISERLKENSNVLEITEKDLEDSEFVNVIYDFKNKYMGDIFSRSNSQCKPFQITPLLNFQKDPTKFKEELFSAEGENVMLNLLELNIYINTIAKPTSEVLFESTYRQFISPIVSVNSEKMSKETIKNIFYQLDQTNLTSINVIAGDLHKDSGLNSVIEILNKFSCKRTFHIHSSQLCEIENLSDVQNASIKIHLEFPFDEKALSRSNELYKWDLSFSFVVQNISEYENAVELIDLYDIDSYEFQPFYNGRNLDFFKESIFMTKEDLFETRIEQKELFARMKINKNYFGKLSILPNGDVYSNLNKPILGNVVRNSFKDMIYGEIVKGLSWRSTRDMVEPCKGCAYNFLCPPLSNYEYVLGENNLCMMSNKC